MQGRPRPAPARTSSTGRRQHLIVAGHTRMTKETPMPDYGHPLRFATFISPANSPAHRPVELAQLSERLGFDFVTFQDHPYKSDFLDTWTLLSWVAARTERIGLSGNVLNLPLRQPPAVLARASASLDLLSGGRTSLGLGAGFFWGAGRAN